jgi:hypothetical protein
MPTNILTRRNALQFTLMLAAVGVLGGCVSATTSGNKPVSRGVRLATDGRGWGVLGVLALDPFMAGRDRVTLEAALASEGYLPTGPGKPKEMHDATWKGVNASLKSVIYGRQTSLWEKKFSACNTMEFIHIDYDPGNRLRKAQAVVEEHGCL